MGSGAIEDAATGAGVGCGAPAAVIGGATCGAATSADAGVGAEAVSLTGAARDATAADTGGAACTLVTMACAVADAALSPEPAGRSTSDMTTAAPAVAPTAVATNTTRKVRIKLGAGAR
ncbi:MAG TPA: hypothetical protein VHX43_05570 [Xanthobacteraceae bacterium]|nr:hypothetical protein [Xanthobacteraceae bacterium]